MWDSHHEHICLQKHVHRFLLNHVHRQTYTRKYDQGCLWKHMHRWSRKHVHGCFYWDYGCARKHMFGRFYWKYGRAQNHMYWHFHRKGGRMWKHVRVWQVRDVRTQMGVYWARYELHRYRLSKEDTKGGQIRWHATSHAGFVGKDETVVIFFNFSKLLVVMFSTN